MEPDNYAAMAKIRSDTRLTKTTALEPYPARSSFQQTLRRSCQTSDPQKDQRTKANQEMVHGKTAAMGVFIRIHYRPKSRGTVGQTVPGDDERKRLEKVYS
jgi:hypothetical protein